MCARKIVNCFCLHSYNRRSLISRFVRGWQLKSWCRSGRESSEGKSIFNTWQPRSTFIYSFNNTRLLTAGCKKSDLRHLKHWYRLLCPGVVKSILVEAGYMRLFHTPRTSFLLTTSFENTILARVLFLFQERTWEHPLQPFWIRLCVSVRKSTTWSGPRMFCLFTVGRDDDPKELLCAVWPATTLFNSGTELEAAEWIKFLVLDTRFSSNSSRTHRLILSFPACPVIRISGYERLVMVEGGWVPNCWTCFVFEGDVRCWLWGKSSLKKRGILLMLIFSSCWIRHISNVDYYINRWSWTDFIVDVEKKCWTADWLLMLVVILIRWILHHSAYHYLTLVS